MPNPRQQSKGRVKGAIIREFFSWYEQEVGTAAFAQRFDGIDGPIDSTQKGCGLLPSKWYDFSVIHRYLDAMERAHSRDELQAIVSNGARASLTATLSTFHQGLILRIASPPLHARFAQVLWATHYNTGEVTSEHVSETEQLVSYRNWNSHHPVLCAMTGEADNVIFPMMGLKNVTVIPVSCVTSGASSCAHRVTWTM